MKTYYSIIFTPFSSLGNEKINLGLLLFQEGGISMVKFSDEKLSTLKKLISAESYKLIKIQTSSFKDVYHSNNNFGLGFNQINADFIEYLSNYTNNLISITPPKKIDVDVNDSVFDKLFEQFVYKAESLTNQEIKTQSNLLNAKLDFVPKVKDRVNVDFTLKPSNFDFVVFNMNVDLIGRNDASVLTQFIDFQSSTDAIRHRVNDYVSLIKPFEIKEKRPGKFFIVGQEPDRDSNKQRLIWENLLKSSWVTNNIIEIVRPDELDSIEQYLVTHDVKPFSLI